MVVSTPRPRWQAGGWERLPRLRIPWRSMLQIVWQLVGCFVETLPWINSTVLLLKPVSTLPKGHERHLPFLHHHSSLHVDICQFLCMLPPGWLGQWSNLIRAQRMAQILGEFDVQRLLILNLEGNSTKMTGALGALEESRFEVKDHNTWNARLMWTPFTWKHICLWNCRRSWKDYERSPLAHCLTRTTRLCLLLPSTSLQYHSMLIERKARCHRIEMTQEHQKTFLL